MERKGYGFEGLFLFMVKDILFISFLIFGLCGLFYLKYRRIKFILFVKKIKFKFVLILIFFE